MFKRIILYFIFVIAIIHTILIISFSGSFLIGVLSLIGSFIFLPNTIDYLKKNFFYSTEPDWLITFFCIATGLIFIIASLIMGSSVAYKKHVADLEERRIKSEEYVPLKRPNFQLSGDELEMFNQAEAEHRKQYEQNLKDSQPVATLGLTSSELTVKLSQAIVRDQITKISPELNLNTSSEEYKSNVRLTDQLLMELSTDKNTGKLKEVNFVLSTGSSEEIKKSAELMKYMAQRSLEIITDSDTDVDYLEKMVSEVMIAISMEPEKLPRAERNINGEVKLSGMASISFGTALRIFPVAIT